MTLEDQTCPQSGCLLDVCGVGAQCGRFHFLENDTSYQCWTVEGTKEAQPDQSFLIDIFKLLQL